ncbi:MAG: hypothetical protein ABSF26_19235 [Thermoguttaceae bacterium]|jgi:hypothetical protein
MTRTLATLLALILLNTTTRAITIGSIVLADFGAGVRPARAQNEVRHA